LGGLPKRTDMHVVEGKWVKGQSLFNTGWGVGVDVAQKTKITSMLWARQERKREDKNNLGVFGERGGSCVRGGQATDTRHKSAKQSGTGKGQKNTGDTEPTPKGQRWGTYFE